MAALTNTELLTALTGRCRSGVLSGEPGLRFAFYGRMSTSIFQDAQTSRAWQRAISDELIEGVGSVVVEFFDGPVELGSPVHEALMVLLGAQAQREVARARQRVLAAMRSQTRLQGRFLGGRPPYGYRLVDGGRHPNPVHGRWGRRVQVLAPDPVTAPWVRWMFAERARGRTVASLAREQTWSEQTWSERDCQGSICGWQICRAQICAGQICSGLCSRVLICAALIYEGLTCVGHAWSAPNTTAPMSPMPSPTPLVADLEADV